MNFYNDINLKIYKCFKYTYKRKYIFEIKVFEMNNYVIGLDYGSDSVRAVLMNTETGKEEASSTHCMLRWKEGKFCDASNNQFRQHPLDHIEGLENTIKSVLKKQGLM